MFAESGISSVVSANQHMKLVLDSLPIIRSDDTRWWISRRVDLLSMKEAARRGGLFSCSVCYCLFTPFCTAPGSLAVPVLCVPAAVSAPEVLASPRGEGALLAPVVPWFMVPSFIAPSDAPGPTLPWLDAPPVGCVVCAKAVGVASAKMQAEANSIFFIWGSSY
jgi:hypothetical protein